MLRSIRVCSTLHTHSGHHISTHIVNQSLRHYTSNFSRDNKLPSESPTSVTNQKSYSQSKKQPKNTKKWLDRDPVTNEVVLPSFLSARHDAEPESLESLLVFISKHRKKGLSIRSNSLKRKIDTLRSKYWRQLTKGHADMLIEACVAAKTPKFALRLLQRFWPAPDSQYLALDQSVQRPPTQLPSDAPWPNRWEHALQAITENLDHSFPAQQLLDEFVSYVTSHGARLKPSYAVSIMQCLGNQERWTDIIALADQCRTAGPPLSLYAYAEVMQAYRHTNQWQAAFELLAEAREQPHIKSSSKITSIYHACITTLGVCHKPQLALDVFQTMKHQQLPITAFTYAAVINALAEPDSPDSPPSPFTYAHIFAIYEEVVLAEVKFVMPLYFSLIRACLRFNETRFAFSIFDEMLTFALENDQGGAWKRVGTFANEPRIWQFLSQIGVAVDDAMAIPTLTARLCDAYRLGRHTLTAPQRAEAPAFLSIYYVNDLLEYLIRVKRPDLIDWVWRHMESIDVQDNHVSLYYRILAELMRVEDEPERMEEVVEMLCDALQMIKLHDLATIELITGDWTSIEDKRSLTSSIELYCLMAVFEPLMRAKLNDENLLLPTTKTPFKIKVSEKMIEPTLTYLASHHFKIDNQYNIKLTTTQLAQLGQSIIEPLQRQQWKPIKIPDYLIEQWTLSTWTKEGVEQAS